MLSCADMTGEEQIWLDCAARMAAAGKAAAQGLYGTASGRVMLGRGAGGDRTLELDRACESAILGVLEREAPFSLLARVGGSGQSAVRRTPPGGW